jgi:hypothetical protein
MNLILYLYTYIYCEIIILITGSNDRLALRCEPKMEQQLVDTIDDDNKI